MKYLETANELTKGLNSLFSGLTLGRFLKWIITIIVIFVAVLFVYESFFSSSFYFDKIDRKLTIIEKVKSLAPNDSTISKQTNKQLLEILNNLDEPRNKYLNFQNIGISLPQSLTDSLLKVLGAAILPLLIMFAVRKEPDRSDTITGAILFIVIFGIISVFIPTIYSIWVNILLMPIAQLIILIPFIIKNK